MFSQLDERDHQWLNHLSMHEGIEQSLIGLHEREMSRDFRREALFDHLVRYLPKTGRAIDVGCGTGFMVEKLCQRGLEVIGLEISEKLLDFARKKMTASPYAPTLIGKGIMEAKEYGPAKAVLCLDVIEHIEDDFAAIDALRETCRDNAQLILTVPAHPTLFSVRDKSLGHYRRYTKAGLRLKLQRAGFTVEHCYHWNAIGVPYYGLFGKILKRDVADNLRTGSDNRVKKRIRDLVKTWLKAEGLFKTLPIGLTLIAIAHVKND